MIRLFKMTSVLIVGLILSSLIHAGCSLDLLAVDQAPNTPDSRVVEIKPSHQSCELASDCVIVYIDCSGCDCGVPVNRDFETKYRDLYQELCSTYAGAVCEMYCPQVSLVCNSGICDVEPLE
jgi:hypothetical protein